ncbi:hypothetical protein E4U21_005203 [Claviceps maximensis]|nr:hypothetical protein E4U21_005203 [Claviceps maximensis]
MDTDSQSVQNIGSSSEMTEYFLVASSLIQVYKKAAPILSPLKLALYRSNEYDDASGVLQWTTSQLDQGLSHIFTSAYCMYSSAEKHYFDGIQDLVICSG